MYRITIDSQIFPCLHSLISRKGLGTRDEVVLQNFREFSRNPFSVYIRLWEHRRKFSIAQFYKITLFLSFILRQNCFFILSFKLTSQAIRVGVRQENMITCKNVTRAIDHFRITLGLFFKASLGAYPFICKLIFIHTQIKLILCEWKLICIWKDEHLNSLWKRGLR